MRKIIKLIDYCFQNKEQLTEAYDDSNSMRYLNPDFNIEIIGRYGEKNETYIVKDDSYEYKVKFFPWHSDCSSIINYIFHEMPDVIHMHGTSAWPLYPIYANHFNEWMPDTKLIFSPAGNCRGPESFLENFDTIIVNHPLQISRMKCLSDKIVVRKRSADDKIFHRIDSDQKKFDLVYVAGFVPIKRIDVMIDLVAETPYSLVILGDFTRKVDHHRWVRNKIMSDSRYDKIFLHDFIPQYKMAEFFSNCGVFVWPNIPPENPGTTTNRSIAEALACRMPLLLGERAFESTEYVINGFNGYLYSGVEDFIKKARWLLNNPVSYRNNASRFCKDHFSFQKNFVDFYNNLYSL